MSRRDFNVPMRKRNFNVTDVIKKFLFVGFLIIVGFATERAWQNYLHESRNDTPVTEGRTRVVVIGSSIAIGMAPKIQHYLREYQGRDDVDVFDMSLPLLNSDVALERARSAIEQYRPRQILFMVGMHEDFDRSGWLRSAKELAKSGSGVELANQLLASMSSGDYLRPLVFLSSGFERVPGEDFFTVFLPGLFKNLDALAPNVANDETTRKRTLALIHIGLITLRGKKATQAGKLPSEQDSLEFFSTEFKRIVGSLRDWPRETQRLGFERFVRSSDPLDSLYRYWFWCTWSHDDASAERDAVDYYVRHAGYFAFAVQLPKFAQSEEGIRTRLPGLEPRSLLHAIAKTNSTAGAFFIFNGKLGRGNGRYENDDALLFERVPKLLEFVKSQGIRPVLVHYPTLRLRAVDDLASRFDVAAIAGTTSLDELVKKNGRSLYFLDQVGETGHLTEAGLEVFSRAIANDLSRL